MHIVQNLLYIPILRGGAARGLGASDEHMGPHGLRETVEGCEGASGTSGISGDCGRLQGALGDLRACR
jgi:hypothetical protein